MRDWLEERGSRWAGRAAIIDAATDRTFTYDALDARATKLARLLHARGGVGGGDRVALIAHNRPFSFELLFACSKLGATFVPLSWRLAPAELASVVADCDPRAIVYEDALEPLAEAAVSAAPGASIIRLPESDGDGEPALLRRPDDTSEPGALTEETIAVILYTSGTTGRPKGVMLPWRQLFFNAINTTLACDLRAGDKCLAFLPLFHTGGLNCLATPLLFRGGTVVLERRFDPERSVALLDRAGIEATIAVPTMYQMLIDAGLLERRLPRARAMLCGGAPCPESLIARMHEAGLPFRQGYGSTEVGPNCFTLSPLDGPHRVGSVGMAAFHGESRVVGDDGLDVASDEHGELWLRGPHVSAGYYGRPSHTDEDGWYHTGDLVRRTADGFYYVVGRKKDMFISGGENVYPAEIENALDAHPAVHAAAVIGAPDRKWGQVGVAFVVPREAVLITEDDLLAFLRDRIARFKVPRRIHFVDALPANATGKVNKEKLLELDAQLQSQPSVDVWTATSST